MQLVKFQEANVVFRPPGDLTEGQCRSVDAWKGEVNGGSCDGLLLVVVAWKPTEKDVQRLVAGGCVYLSCVGGLPPHFLVTSFEETQRIA